MVFKKAVLVLKKWSWSLPDRSWSCNLVVLLHYWTKSFCLNLSGTSSKRKILQTVPFWPPLLSQPSTRGTHLFTNVWL